MQNAQLYKTYLEELHPGKSLIETEAGFVVYWLRGKECYIEDVYVKPEFRKAGVSKLFSDEVAKVARQHDCTFLSGTVVPTAKNSTTSLKMMLSSGFKLHSAEQNLIIFTKELS